MSSYNTVFVFPVFGCKWHPLKPISGLLIYQRNFSIFQHFFYSTVHCEISWLFFMPFCFVCHCISLQLQKLSLSRFIWMVLPSFLRHLTWWWVKPMDQISTKTPNPKCRLFLKIDLVKVLGGRCLSVWGPWSPPPLLHTVCKHTHTYPCTYPHREGGEGG